MAVSIAEVLVLCLLADWIFRKFSIPGLIGMLFVGVLLGPHVVGVLDPDLIAISDDLRLIALIVILLRAGFEIRRRTLHRVGGRALMLAFIPATCEGVMITLVAPSLLGLTYFQAAILASVLAAVSPAVVVPLMIRFIKQRKGASKDIPSMVLAAASVDDIFVIVIHGVLVAMYVGQEANIAWQVAGIPLSLVLGAGTGLAIGALLCRLFERFNPRATKRVLTVIAISILLVRVQDVASEHIPFAGLVAAMAIGFFILEKREHMAREISAKLAKIWVFAEILLFSLIGAQVNVSLAWRAGLAGTVLIALALVARAAGVMACLAKSKLTHKERFFVAVAYSPKATVQAAIGAVPLMAMRVAGMDAGPGELILAVAVLSIILTAPAGAWAIEAVGARVLCAEPESSSDAYDTAVESCAEAKLK